MYVTHNSIKCIHNQIKFTDKTLTVMRGIYFAAAIACSVGNSFRFRPTMTPKFERSRDIKMTSNVEVSKFITPAIASSIREQYQTPIYVYDEATLVNQASNALNFPNSYGVTVRCV